MRQIPSLPYVQLRLTIIVIVVLDLRESALPVPGNADPLFVSIRTIDESALGIIEWQNGIERGRETIQLFVHLPLNAADHNGILEGDILLNPPEPGQEIRWHIVLRS